MSMTGTYPRTCPKCGSEGEAVKATTAKGDSVVVDLKCGACAHLWSVTLQRPL